MRKLFLMLGLVAAPTMAAPVSLKCSFEPNNEVLFTLNEDQGTATYTTKAATQTQKALFTADTVTIVAMKDSIINLVYRFSRVDLSAQRSLQIGSKPPEVKETTCKLYTPPKRAF